MRLAEAIRLGAMMHPQAQGVLAMKFTDGTVHTCALGAALCAVGHDLSALCGGLGFYVLAPPEWHATLTTPVRQCPACVTCHTMHPLCDVQGAIVHLNDVHGWTRERIADWLDTVTGETQPTVASAMAKV